MVNNFGMQDVMDARAQHLLRSWICEDLTVAEQAQLKSLLYCQTQVVNYGGDKPMVFVLSDGERAHFHGQSHCQNPWCCPICAARRMEFYRTKIAAGIDMLRAEDMFGFMMTFTIPHLRFMNCREVTDVLYRTWTYFRRKNFKKNFHVYQQFDQAVDVKHWVRVCEYTYGDNGWHPHFHTIFWVPKENADDVLEWQSKLNDFWIKTAKREMKKYWQEKHLHEDKDLDDLIDQVFRYEHEQIAVKISTDKKTGKILEALSSTYLTGWGADRETTGNIHKQASHEGHLTPYQILYQATEGNKDMRKLYLEFCLSVTRKPVHHRVDFSQTGVSARIDEYLEKQEEVVYEHCEKKTSWEVVDYFTSEQWYDISYADRFAPVLSNILYLAARHKELLAEYIESIVGKRKYSTTFLERMKVRCREVEDLFNRNRSIAEAGGARSISITGAPKSKAS